MHSFPSTLDLLLQLLHRPDVLGGLIHEYQAPPDDPGREERPARTGPDLRFL